jgi:hypothetical protein
MTPEFWLGNVKGRDHSEYVGIDEKMGLRETRWEGVDWIHMAQDRE